MARPSMGMNDPGDGPPRTTVSTDSVMNAKFNRPPTRDDWVDRARLVGQLDEAIQLPVTLVSAPAGYGKTTLISQWLAATRNPRAAWVSLDPGDNDPGRLWRHLSVALERVGCTVPEERRVVGKVLPWRDRRIALRSGSRDLLRHAAEALHAEPHRPRAAAR